DFNGTLDGNIRCATFILRDKGVVNGEITADSAMIYGKVKGLIRAKNVQLFSTCRVEGIIMHEGLTIEDGAFVDGKFKRTDKAPTAEEDEEESTDAGGIKMLENIRLIR
ncbi:MAG: polymer-forming cytoskeletal protein, partial [Pseudomonadota bacterium]|nr:polymer-forming cytoskeletal protein [Pseudomonadota bacterium]